MMNNPFFSDFNQLSNNPIAMFALGLVSLIFFAAVILAVVLFLLSLYKNLNGISPKNRKMEPGLVWLNLIPCFSLGWMIYTVISIKESNLSEFKEKNIDQSVDLNFGTGLTYSILSIISSIPYVGLLTIIPCIICWIIFWTTTSNMTRTLKEYNAKNPASPENTAASAN